MDRGFIKLWRRFFDHPLWNEKRVFSKAEAWLWMLKTANFSEEYTQLIVGKPGIKLKRGQLVASNRYMQQAFGWSNNKVDYFIKYLRQENMVKCDTDNDANVTVLTIVNYSSYNDIVNGDNSEDATPVRQEMRQRSDSDATPVRQRSDKEKNSKKDNNSKKDDIGATPPPDRKKSLTKKRIEFKEPTKEEAHLFFENATRGKWDVGKAWKEADSYLDHYNANGWIQNGNKPIIDWKAAARNWIRRDMGGQFQVKTGQGAKKDTEPITHPVTKPAVNDIPKNAKDPTGLSIAFLYEYYLDGKLKMSEVLISYYHHLKEKGLLKFPQSVREAIVDEAKKMRVKMSDAGESLQKAYETGEPLQLLENDKENLINCSQRVAIIKFFEKCKNEKLTEIKKLLGV